MDARFASFTSFLTYLNIESEFLYGFSGSFNVVAQSFQIWKPVEFIRGSAQATFSDSVIPLIQFRSDVVPPIFFRNDCYRSGSHVRIQDNGIFLRRRKYDSSYKILRELTRMDGLLFMVVLHVPEHPDVSRVLSVRIARKLPTTLTTKMFLVLILLWNSHRIEIKHIVIRLCEPQYRLVPSRKLALRVQTVLPCPDYSISG